MKLYEFEKAPNPWRVRIFMAEKGVEAERVEIDIMAGENLSDEYLAMNPFGRVPVLELDDGTYISETVAICRYFEEAIPDPALFGTDPVEKAIIEMWNRFAEMNLLFPVAFAFRNTTGIFKDRENCFADFGADMAKVAMKNLTQFEARLADSSHLGGDTFSAADITGVTSLKFGQNVQVLPKDLSDFPSIARWEAEVKSRPSFKA